LGDEAEAGSLTFANFVEFDSLYGHPRDVSGYARALEWFDAQVPRFLARLRPGDLAIFTADHGNDPTWRGTEHTRERVPVLWLGPWPARGLTAPLWMWRFGRGASGGWVRGAWDRVSCGPAPGALRPPDPPGYLGTEEIRSVS
jgi:hypothetical protein